MKLWISKYALTTGIFEIEARETHSPDMIADKNNTISVYHGEGKEWHKTKEDAIQMAEIMRQKKIKSLERQLEKIKTLKI
jgi:tRNA G10  N-methylase Trm11